MKIVKFDDGCYGIKKGNWLTGYSYKDLQSRFYYWWTNEDEWFGHCKGNWELVSQQYKLLVDQYGN